MLRLLLNKKRSCQLLTKSRNEVLEPPVNFASVLAINLSAKSYAPSFSPTDRQVRDDRCAFDGGIANHQRLHAGGC